jgi:DNA polymerase-1
MAHQAPNTANIPSAYKEDGTKKLYGKEMRSLWRAPKNRLLVGVDAEGIQLRIFAHYINDPEFTEALVRGKKDEGTDPHTLNQRILGSVCKTRQAAKRFIYALLLGAGVQKLSQILDCTVSEAEEALDRVLQRYEGFQHLKLSKIPADAKRGFFEGLDGRPVRIPGDTVGERKHLCMSGYLQAGEQIVIKKTAVGAKHRLVEEDVNYLFVDIVHDEYVIEVENNIKKAEKVRDIICEEIEKAGVDLKLLCPLKGDGGIGLTWMDIH